MEEQKSCSRVEGGHWACGPSSTNVEGDYSGPFSSLVHETWRPGCALLAGRSWPAWRAPSRVPPRRPFLTRPAATQTRVLIFNARHARVHHATVRETPSVALCISASVTLLSDERCCDRSPSAYWLLATLRGIYALHGA